MRRLMGVFVTAGLLAGTAVAAGRMADRDRGFVTKATQGGFAEVQLGGLAIKNANSKQVIQFGERMIRDHMLATTKLVAIAAREGVALPTGIGTENQRSYDELASKKGAAFDRAYAEAMVKDHEADVKAFRKMSKKARDRSVKKFAAQTLPTLEQHLKLARSLEPNRT